MPFFHNKPATYPLSVPAIYPLYTNSAHYIRSGVSKIYRDLPAFNTPNSAHEILGNWLMSGIKCVK